MENYVIGLGVILLCSIIALLLLLYLKNMEAKFSRLRVDELEQELAENLKNSDLEKKALIKGARDWMLKATAPMMPDLNPPLIIHKSDLQKVTIKIKLSYPIMREKAIRQGVDKLIDFIAPLVYSEFIKEENGDRYLYQEIWVGLSEKYNTKDNG